MTINIQSGSDSLSFLRISFCFLSSLYFKKFNSVKVSVQYYILYL